jgi:hypothetical protein
MASRKRQGHLPHKDFDAKIDEKCAVLQRGRGF